MPQFDFFSSFSQIFLVTFGCFACYLVFLKLTLKNTSEVLKLRNKLFDSLKNSVESINSAVIKANINAIIRKYFNKN